MGEHRIPWIQQNSPHEVGGQGSHITGGDSPINQRGALKDRVPIGLRRFPPHNTHGRAPAPEGGYREGSRLLPAARRGPTGGAGRRGRTAGAGPCTGPAPSPPRGFQARGLGLHGATQGKRKGGETGNGTLRGSAAPLQPGTKWRRRSRSQRRLSGLKMAAVPAAANQRGGRGALLGDERAGLREGRGGKAEGSAPWCPPEVGGGARGGETEARGWLLVPKKLCSFFSRFHPSFHLSEVNASASGG